MVFTRDNITLKATGMCLPGHIVQDIELYILDEHLLVLPVFADEFQLMNGDLTELEEYYLYLDKQQ